MYKRLVFDFVKKKTIKCFDTGFLGQIPVNYVSVFILFLVFF